MTAPTDAAARRPLIAIVGNPNTGKTTLFNRLTGQRAAVGNYPGVTVERRLGQLRAPDGDQVVTLDLLDVPGCYSICARSPEEQVAIQALLGQRDNPRPDVVMVVLDATQLVRNLYLAVQVAELDLPLVLVVNMMDEVAGAPPDARGIGAVFGVPCVPVSGRTGDGIVELKRTLARAARERTRSELALPYPAAVEAVAEAVAPALELEAGVTARRRRSMALWALGSIDRDDELDDIEPRLRQAVEAARAAHADVDLDLSVTQTRYAFLERSLQALYTPPPPRTWTERLDRVLLHPVAGFAIFLAIMLVVFQSLFVGADPLITLVEDGFAGLAGWVSPHLPEGWVRGLITEGVIGGVGSVVVFLPQILLLFLFIGILEGSGYMARAAYLMDRIMRSLGLHGRAFVPMMSGYACAIPAVMATRTMERRRDQLLTMMVVPLMSCSARLPVYTLVIGALFPPTRLAGVLPVQGLMMVGMYLFSTAVALTAAAVLGRTLLKGPKVPLLLELPPYRWPSWSTTLRTMWERAKTFLTEAGTVILGCTVVLWGMLHYPALPDDPSPTQEAATVAVSADELQARALEHSLAGRVGHALEPVIAPLGFDWKIGVGLMGAFAAREVFVSTMGLVYGVGDQADEASAPLRDRMKAEVRADGRPVYTPLVGLSLLVFFALACQCMSTLAVVYRETQSWRWTLFLFAYMTVLAWGASFVVYQGGRLLGFS